MRLLLKGAETSLPSTVGTATSLSNAKGVVRVVNTATDARSFGYCSRYSRWNNFR